MTRIDLTPRSLTPLVVTATALAVYTLVVMPPVAAVAIPAAPARVVALTALIALPILGLATLVATALDAFRTPVLAASPARADAWLVLLFLLSIPFGAWSDLAVAAQKPSWAAVRSWASVLHALLVIARVAVVYGKPFVARRRAHLIGR